MPSPLLSIPPAGRPYGCSSSRTDLIKLDIVNEVVTRTGISKSKSVLAVEPVFEPMKSALEKVQQIKLRGYVLSNVRPRKTGNGRNPRTGEEVSFPPGKAVRFKPG